MEGRQEDRVNDLEILSEEFPLTADRIQELGLRGIHSGSGSNLHPGWLNTDCMQLKDRFGNTSRPGHLVKVDQTKYYLQHDNAKPFPIADEAFDWAFSEHFIEHIGLREAVGWLREIRRMLKKDGFIRLSTPDLRRYVEGYLDSNNEFYQLHRNHLLALGMEIVPDRPAWMLNQIFQFWGHKWIYDFDEIRTVAAAAGFAPSSAKKFGYRQGRVADIYKLDLIDRKDESLYVEIYRT